MIRCKAKNAQGITLQEFSINHADGIQKCFSMLIKSEQFYLGVFNIYKPFPAPIKPWFEFFFKNIIPDNFVRSEEFAIETVVNGSTICILTCDLMTSSKSLMNIKNTVEPRIEPWEHARSCDISGGESVQNYHYLAIWLKRFN